MTGLLRDLRHAVRQLRKSRGFTAGANTALFSVVDMGFPLAAGNGKLISSMLFELKAPDVTTYAGVLLALTVFAVPSAALPAWRASRVEPMVALKYE